jgi:hypothetical protein
MCSPLAHAACVSTTTTIQRRERARVERTVQDRDDERERTAAAAAAPQPTGVAERSHAAPSPQPTRATAADARTRVRADPLTRLRRAHAERALRGEPNPNARDPFVRHKQEIGAQLDRLGVNRTSRDRVHIDDVDRDHGAAVARTAAGRTSLARGSDVRLNTEGLPRDFRSRHLSPEQARRYDTFDGRMERMIRGNPGVDQLARFGAEQLERTLLEKQMRLENIRNNTPNDGNKTFVNMSWGQTPHESADNMMGAIMMARPGSRLRNEVSKFLGHEPRSQEDAERVMRGMVYPALDRTMRTPEHQARMQAARTGLEQELSRGRERGILAFQAAGNAYEDASRFGRPDFSKSSTDGVRGLITVGAVDLRGPGTADDRVTSFSSDGRIQVSAPGKDIPVGRVRRGVPQREDGTSFASPNAVDVARAMSAANPRLSANDIARLITDPRAVNDIRGTTRDGAGHLDPFAAVMLARDPSLTRAQIDALRMRAR